MDNLGYKLINKEYFNKHYKEIYELDIFPFHAKNLLENKSDVEEAHRIISKKLEERDEAYYEYRRETYTASIEEIHDYDLGVLIMYCVKHPEHSDLFH